MRIAISATGPSMDAQVDPRFGRCQCFLIVNTDDMSFEAIENPNSALGGGAGIQSAQLMAGNGVQSVLTGNCGPNAYQTLSAAGINVIVGCGGSVADVVAQFKAGQLGEAAGEPNVASHFGASGSPPANQSPPTPLQAPMTGGGAGMGRGMGQGGGAGMGRGMGQGGGAGMGRGMGQGGRRGMGQGGGRGVGQGGGRGMGQGGGRAMGQGGGRGMAMNTGIGTTQAATPVPRPQALNTIADQELSELKQQAQAMNLQTEQLLARIRQLEQQGQSIVSAKVDAEKCTGCTECVEVCATGAVSFSEGVAVIDQKVCTGCGACVEACPTDAISLK